MKRRQFLKGIAAAAVAALVPFKRNEWSASAYSKWDKRHLFAHLYGYRFNAESFGTQTGRTHFTKLNFEEIEKRALAGGYRPDSEWHHFAQNSRGEFFFDGRQV